MSAPLAPLSSNLRLLRTPLHAWCVGGWKSSLRTNTKWTQASWISLKGKFIISIRKGISMTLNHLTLSWCMTPWNVKSPITFRRKVTISSMTITTMALPWDINWRRSRCFLLCKGLNMTLLKLMRMKPRGVRTGGPVSSQIENWSTLELSCIVTLGLVTGSWRNRRMQRQVSKSRRKLIPSKRKHQLD